MTSAIELFKPNGATDWRLEKTLHFTGKVGDRVFIGEEPNRFPVLLLHREGKNFKHELIVRSDFFETLKKGIRLAPNGGKTESDIVELHMPNGDYRFYHASEELDRG